MQTHRRIHTGSKPFECSRCDQHFVQQSQLNQHRRSHEGIRPYACPQCPESFIQLCHLKQHIKIHTGERPYACKHCEKTFSKPYTLQVHERGHTGVKPYSCDLCDQRFKAIKDLKQTQPQFWRWWELLWKINGPIGDRFYIQERSTNKSYKDKSRRETEELYEQP